MIIHLGDNVSLFEKDILFILDKKSVDSSRENAEFIKRLIESGSLINHVDDIKSYVIAKDEKNNGKNSKNKLKLYLSNISSNSLLHRHKELDRRETND
jgi:hypothetical protein